MNQDVLHPASPQAAHVATLFWWMLGVAAVVYLLVLVAFFVGAFGRRRRGTPVDELHVRSTPETMRRSTLAVSLAVGATAIILLVFVVADYAVGRTLGVKPDVMLTVEVTGHQWWWRIRYKDPEPQREVITANEIHVPVGIPVQFQLRSADVIHSFWVPNMRGKKDAIPGYVSSTWFRADTPGVYRGQCAEFCGHQHAKMAFYVVADSPAVFRSWLAAQQAPADSAPADSLAREGQRVFLAGPCANCHTIRGTPAGGSVGPDLTHLASRLTIAAGTLPRTRGHLAGWVVDPQRIKPGAQMPPNQLEPEALRALLAYLETLR